MIEHETIINDLATYTEEALSQCFSTARQVAAKNDGLYDVRINLKSTTTTPQLYRQVSFSYDKEVGYFLDIDSVTLEFDFDTKTYIDTSKKYIKALSSNKIKITKRKTLGLINKTDIEILD